MPTMESQGFARRTFAHAGTERPVFEKGDGPAVLLMHELPGLTDATVGFAERLIAHGFRVALPLLFGEPLHAAPIGNVARLCVSAEFARMKAGASAPVTLWLRALAADLAARGGGRQVGVIGMCLTGAFVIPMVIDPGVRAGVISQPSIPFRVAYRLFGAPAGPWMRELNVADAELDAAANVAARDGKAVLIQRFADDRLCPRARVERIAAAFGNAAESFEYPEALWWRRAVDPPHALLTNEYDRATEPDHPTRVALARVLAFLDRHLKPVHENDV